MKHRYLALPLAALLTFVWVASSTAAKKEFQETTSVVVVEVPVHVIRDGEPVRGLSAENFQILDGRKKMELIGFEEVDLAMIPTSQTSSPAKVPMAARRHFLLLFDLSYSVPSAILKARRAAKETVLDDLHESDLVAVATYATNRGATLVLSFTSDRRQVDLALETLGAPNILDLHPDPLGILLGDSSSISGFSDTLSGSDTDSGGRAGGLESVIEEHLQSIYQASARSQRSEERQRIAALTRSFSDLAGLMAAVDGRKHVVYLSQGFDSSLMLGTSNQAEINRANAASASGEIWDIQGDQRFGSTGTINDLENMIQAFRRSDCSVQSVDIGGLQAGNDMQGRASGKDGMVAMAQGTGGGFYENFNDLGGAMNELLERTSVTYLLAFQPKKLKNDGKYHKIKVKLVNGPSGARLEHRPGYYAPKPLEMQSAQERKLSKGQQILSGEEGGTIEVAAIATPFRVEGENAYVPVFVEVDGSTLMGTSKMGTLGVELYAYAMARDGGLSDYFARQVGLDLAQAGEAIAQGGIKFYGHLDLPPGDYSIRVLVRNVGTGANSLQNVDLHVPQWGDDRPVLLSPVFPEPMGRWVMIREDEAQQKERTVPYPFMSAEGPFFPSAQPTVTAGEQASVWLAAYNLGSADTKIGGRILDEAGTQVGSDLASLDRRVDPAGGVDVISALLPADLKAGKYQLEITVGSESEGGQSAAMAPFEVQ